jgi:ATP/maltotriose-dependent transcriptional regulator MalT
MERMGGAAIGAQQRAPERFPFTKFVPPLLDARVVTERVVERLDAAIGSRSLTLLIAPAGSGKTTALAAWAEATADDVVWVRLDADDAEPAVLAAALLDGGRHQLGHGFGGRLAHLLAYTGAGVHGRGADASTARHVAGQRPRRPRAGHAAPR